MTTVKSHQREAVRLRAGIDLNGKVSSETSLRALAALARFRETLDEFQVKTLRVVGTQAFRMIDPADPFLSAVEEILRAPLEVMSGTEEAYATFQGVLSLEPISNALDHHLVIDIGGGSTEVVLGSSFRPLLAESLPLGGVELTARSAEQPPYHEAFFIKLKSVCHRQMLEPLSAFNGKEWQYTYLAAGMAEVFAELKGPSNKAITRALLKNLMMRYIQGEIMPGIIPSLTQDKWMILPAALCILDTLMAILKIDTVKASKGSLRQSLLLSMMQQPASLLTSV